MLGLLYLFPILGRVIGGPRWHGGSQQPGLLKAGLKFPAGTGLSSLMASALAGPVLLIGLAASALVAVGLLLRFCDA